MVKFVFLFVLLCGIVYSQTDSCVDTISLKGNWFIGYKFKYACWEYEKVQKFISLNQKLTGILKGDSLSAPSIKAAIPFNNIGVFIGMVGGAMVGYNLGRALSGNTVSSGSWVIPVSLMAIDIPLELTGYSLLRKAIRQFNREL